MGGQGSGRKPSTKRLIAADCKAIHVEAFRSDAIHRKNLRIVPQNQLLQYRGFISYRDRLNPKRKIALSTIDTGAGKQEIFLENMRPGVRGSRWYFRCRILENGTICNKRVSSLYLPPGTKEYACRTCHDIAYRRTAGPRKPR